MFIQGPGSKIRDSQSQVTILNHTPVRRHQHLVVVGETSGMCPSMMDTEKTPPGQISLAKVTGPSELLLAQGNAPKFLIKNCHSYKKNNAHHLIGT